MKYTYEDVVTAKDILTGRVNKEDIIGKKGWFLDCIPQDMSLNTLMRLAGNPHTLKDINPSISCLFISDETIDGNVYSYFLPEKEESAAKPKFKIGDRVRIVKDWDGFNKECKSTIGETGRIESVFDDNIKVMLDSDNGWWWYKSDAIELIDDKAALSPVESKDKPAYIPFDLSKEEDRDALRDKWVRSRNPDIFHEFKITQFIRMNDDHQTIYVKAGTNRYSDNDLFSDYTFLDGSPIGKSANGQQMK